MNRKQVPARMNLARRIGSASAMDVEYFCRRCKGHYSTAVPVDSFWQTRCRCGSTNLLIYSMSGEVSAPMRAT